MLLRRLVAGTSHFDVALRPSSWNFQRARDATVWNCSWNFNCEPVLGTSKALLLLCREIVLGSFKGGLDASL